MATTVRRERANQMTKLRSRLLITLILAAVMLSASGSAIAGTPSGHESDSRTSSTWSRPSVRPLSGEPDSGGLSSPQPKVNPTWVDPVSSPWLLQILVRWLMAEKATSGSFHRSL